MDPGKSKTYNPYYRFHPIQYQNAPGHPQLDIFLPGNPTTQYFDPEKIELSIKTRAEGIHNVGISHPWTSRKHSRVCAGRLIVVGHDDRTLHVFTFGGDLEISSKMVGTSCSVKSTAPILDLGLESGKLDSLLDERTIPMMLGVEVEVLLAKRRAAWADEPQVYQKSLSEIDPLTLYQSSLLELENMYEESPMAGVDSYQRFISFIKNEIKYMRVKQSGLMKVQRLSELL